MSLLEASKIDLKGKKVLYVDDEVYPAETDRQFFTLKARLRQQDILFSDAFDSALETLKSYPEIAVTIVDLRIPKNSQDSYDNNPDNPREEWGEKLIKTIIEQYSLQRKIYIIVVSAYTIYTYNSQDISTPILAFYSKPIDFNGLEKNLEFIVKQNLEKIDFQEGKISSTQEKSFDYSYLDPETAVFVQEKTKKLKKLARKMAQDIIDIGKYLMEVKQKLGHGNFYSWIDAEFDWGYSSVTRFMQVADRFKTSNLQEIDISPSALYHLSASSTPYEATYEALERASKGEKITEKMAKNLRMKYLNSAGKTEKIVEPKKNEQSVSYDAESGLNKSQAISKILPISHSSSSQRAKQDKPKQEIIGVYPNKNAREKTWWQLGQHHQLFCGKPTDKKFVDYLPNSIVLTINLPPNNDFSLIPSLNSLSKFSYSSAYNNIDIELLKPMVENSIFMSTAEKDIVVFCYVFDEILLELAVKAGCYCIVAEPDLEKCQQILAIWREKSSVTRVKD